MMKKVLALILATVMVFSLVTVTHAADADDNLVAHWTFDGVTTSSTTVEDVSGNGNNLTINDKTFVSVAGFSGDALDFNSSVTTYDNSKHMTVTDVEKLYSSLYGAEGITLNAKIYKEVKGSGTNFSIFRSKKDNGTEYLEVYAAANKMTSAARAIAGGTRVVTEATNFVYPNIDDSTSPDRWMDLTIVYDYANNTTKIYGDGVLVATSTTGYGEKTFAISPEGLADAGVYYGIGSRTVIMDDVKIYNRALTEAEIKKAVGPVMAYDFEKIEDGKIKDVSGNGMDITVASADLTATPVTGVDGNTISLTQPGTLDKDAVAGMLHGAKQISVSTWFKFPNGYTNTAGQTYIIQDVTSGGIGFALSVNASYQICLELRSAGGDTISETISTIGKRVVGAYSNTDWHHIYIEADLVNKTSKMYYNGALQTSGLTNTIANTTSTYYNFPADSTADSVDLMAGTYPILIDNLKIYSRALTEEEILEQAGKPMFVTASFGKGENTLTAVYNITNTTSSAITPTVVFALYDKTTKMLVDVETETLPAIAANAKVTNKMLTLSNVDIPDNYSYKLLIWNDETGSKPLNKSIVVVSE